MSHESNPYESPQTETVDPSVTPLPAPDDAAEIMSPEYRSATRDAFLLQLPIVAFCLLLLDGGTTGRTATAAFIAFWIGAAVIAVQRPKEPTETDLLYWRFGFLPCLFLAICLRQLIYQY